MPSRIHPRIFAEHEYFGDPPGERRALAALFQFVEIRRIDDGDAAVALNFSSWERQAHQCRAALREPRCARQDAAAVAQFLRSWIHHDRFFRISFSNAARSFAKKDRHTDSRASSNALLPAGVKVSGI